MQNLLNVLIIILNLHLGWTYKPVFVLHGILTGAESMKVIEDEIMLSNPGTIVYTSDRFGGWSSLDNCWYQVQQFGKDMMNYCENHPEGIHLLGYSQGGLLGRAILQSNPGHCVKRFISLSSPQAGQFGDSFLHLIFPEMVAKTAYELFYSYVGQHTSVGNYWNDPHHEKLYKEYSTFLPYVNNEIESGNSTVFRESLLKLEKMVLIGGPDDGVITPWESSHFGYYDKNDTVIEMKEREIYKEDKIGLKTLNEKGKLLIVEMPNVNHFDWHSKVDVIRKVVVPYLN